MLPTLNIAVRVEFMARQVPSQAGNVTHDMPFAFRYAFVPLPLIKACTRSYYNQYKHMQLL